MLFLRGQTNCFNQNMSNLYFIFRLFRGSVTRLDFYNVLPLGMPAPRHTKVLCPPSLPLPNASLRSPQ